METISLNAQHPELVDRSEDHKDSLDVIEVFRTIQGEGPFVGQPATFVRLAGCNLKCPNCDTDYTTGRARLSLHDLYKLVYEMRVAKNLVVLTGGEPFRQTIGQFVRMLLDSAIMSSVRVQIETNGTLFDPSIRSSSFHPYLSIVCSPKGRINNDLRPLISSLKYILDHRHIDPKDGLPTSILGGGRPDRPWKNYYGSIYVQPEYVVDSPEDTSRNIDACIDMCYKFGYTLSLQIHKMLGLP